MSTLWWKPSLLCVTGRGKNFEEGQEEDPQQAVCSGEPQKEESVCRWTGKQVGTDYSLDSFSSDLSSDFFALLAFMCLGIIIIFFFILQTGLPFALHTTWNFRKKSRCFRNRTCKESCTSLLYFYVIIHVNKVEHLNVFPLFLKITDRATEETSGCGEDIYYEGQHNQHLHYGKLVSSFVSIFWTRDRRLTILLLSFSCSVLVCLLGVPAFFLSYHLPLS